MINIMISFKITKSRVVTYPLKMRFSEKTFKKFKNMMHPKLVAKIHKFKKGSYYFLPIYHGCGRRNRNGTNKAINYRIGDMCEAGTYSLNWEPWEKINWNLLPHKIYLTRYMHEIGLNKLAKHKKNKWFDWEKNIYIDRKEWYKAQSEEFVLQIHKPVGNLVNNDIVL